MGATGAGPLGKGGPQASLAFLGHAVAPLQAALTSLFPRHESKKGHPDRADISCVVRFSPLPPTLQPWHCQKVIHSRPTEGDELLQLVQLDLTLHSLGLCQGAHV